MGKTVVLYPGLSVSHFVPMMHLTGALIEHGYAVTGALIDPAINGDAAFAAAVARAAASMPPSVRFHTLPLVEDPPTLTPDADFILRYLDIVGRHNELLHEFLRSMQPHAVVLDSLSVEALGVTKRLGIPGYVLFTSNAAALAAFVQLPAVLAEVLGDPPDLEFFGLPPMPASHLFGEILEDPESELCMPMLCWPLYAEQKMNKLRMVGEMGIAAGMVGWEQGLVQAAEVERKVRLVMESDEGGKLRARAAAHKEAAVTAWDDGGSSRRAFVRFLSDLEDRRPQPGRSGEGQ